VEANRLISGDQVASGNVLVETGDHEAAASGAFNGEPAPLETTVNENLGNLLVPNRVGGAAPKQSWLLALDAVFERR
jgi:hypothetical protein